MDQVILLINTNLSEAAILKSAFLGLSGVSCTYFAEVEEALSWIRGRTVAISAVFLGGTDLALVRRLKELPATRHSLFYSLDRASIQKFPSADILSDTLIVKPFERETFQEKVASLVKMQGRRKLTALFLDETGESRALICRSLAQCGFLTVLEVTAPESAWEILQERGDELSLVVACWETSFHPTGKAASLDLLGRARADARFTRLPFLLVTSPSSVKEIRVSQEVQRAFVERWVGPWLDERSLADHLTSLREELLRQRQVESFLREAGVFLVRGVPRHAVEILAHAVKLHPQSAVLFETLGDMHMANYEEPSYLENAARAFERALNLNAQNRGVAIKCAAAFARLECYEDVARVLKNFLSACGLDDEIRTQLAKLFVQRSDFGAACIELRRALSINPVNSEARSLLRLAKVTSA